jgi:hypothetical protein
MPMSRNMPTLAEGQLSSWAPAYPSASYQNGLRSATPPPNILAEKAWRHLRYRAHSVCLPTRDSRLIERQFYLKYCASNSILASSGRVSNQNCFCGAGVGQFKIIHLGEKPAFRRNDAARLPRSRRIGSYRLSRQDGPRGITPVIPLGFPPIKAYTCATPPSTNNSVPVT